ncbi:MAG TPA: hypothetical protein VM819_18305 [Vicinamibacterales bacterium]|jgi:hypothetical protein|nr:hypothetical protein [Vicinamibacterales bacterium]
MRIVSGSVLLAAMVLASASSVVIAQGAKPAPVTVEQHAATMKMIAQNAGAAAKALKGGDAAAATPAAEALVTAFTTIETFYTQRNKPDAIKLAQTAKAGAQEAVAALKAGDTMKAQMAIGNAQATCKQCHGMYREQDEATKAYRFNAASGITPP